MDWKNILKTNVTRASELREFMPLTEQDEKALDAILKQFPMSVPRYYLSLIDWKNYQTDPVFRMCIPSISETDLSGAFDTSGESDNTIMSGLQHKYDQTALILSTHRCAMYCRHCFRKRLVGVSNNETAGVIHQMADYVRQHNEISNVLISGGDAFLNSNDILRTYLESFSSIGHLDLIRFGTRTPVVLPMRIYDDPELLSLLSFYSEKKQIYVVTQFNHPNELTPEAIKAVHALTQLGIIVKNQTVLLKGINDNSQTLGSLLKKLTASGIVPYYIFQCRPVSGVKNQFQVPFMKGYRIIEEAKNMQNGQGKCIRYIMSHPSGKIEILGPAGEHSMYFKFHQAKNTEDLGKIFVSELTDHTAWLYDRI